MTRRLLSPLAVCAAAFLLAACSDPYGLPLNNDPVRITARLRGLDSVFANRLLQSTSALGVYFRPAREPGRLVADSLLGRTFEWDAALSTYAPGARSGAPRNAVRQLLYAVVAGQPVAPLVEIGAADFVPLSASSLRAVVRAGADPPAADLNGSGTFGTSAFAATFRGALVHDGRRLDVVARYAADPAAATSEFDLSLAGGALHVLSRVTQRVDTGITIRYEVHYALHASGGSITMTGWITATPAPGTWTGVTNVADVEFLLNGHRFATLHGTGAGIALRDPSGAPLPTDHTVALNAVFRSPGILQIQLGTLLQPTLNLLHGI